VRGLQLVFTVCGSNQSALRQTQQFLAEFDALAQELSKAELAAQPFLQAFKAHTRAGNSWLWIRIDVMLIRIQHCS
jgi:hypothetical protein